MTWGEAVRLTQILTSDPGSYVFAAAADWAHPATREWIILAALRDSTEYGRVGRKATPMPRPWEKPKHFGNGRYSRAQMRALLDDHRAEVTPHG